MKGAKPAANAGGGAGPTSPKAGGAAGGSGAAGGDRNSVKANLNLAIDIIHNCFNLNAPKSI